MTLLKIVLQSAHVGEGLQNPSSWRAGRTSHILPVIPVRPDGSESIGIAVEWAGGGAGLKATLNKK